MGLAKVFSIYVSLPDYQDVMYNGCCIWRWGCLPLAEKTECFQVGNIPLRTSQCILCDTVEDVSYIILFCIRSAICR